MVENNENIKQGFGQIQIADEVLAIIAATAAMEVEGIRASSNAQGNSIVEFFGKKNQSKGVKVQTDETGTSVEIDILVEFGIHIQQAALEVQKRIKSAIETMTGICVSAVNVYISGVVMPQMEEIASSEE
ncbi:MAG: Asp23/Gls24 family envelope stress response protein [Clostridiales bacterium]|nr:Asp23/Gls24 family envelope stress response protein [Clostridiales bacterium]